MRPTPQPPNALLAVSVRARRLLLVAVTLVLAVALLRAAGRPVPSLLRDDPAVGAASHAHAWRAVYSRRFPGCVALLLWPREEQPRALVVRTRGGRVEQLSVREAVLTAGEGRLRTIGACR